MEELGDNPNTYANQSDDQAYMEEEDVVHSHDLAPATQPMGSHEMVGLCHACKQGHNTLTSKIRASW